MDSMDVEGTSSFLVLTLRKCLTLPSQTESADEWSYQKGLEGGWIPQDPTQRLYPGLCQGTTN